MNFYKAKIDGKSYNSIPVSVNDISMKRFLAFRKVPMKHELELIYWLLDAKPEFKDNPSVEMELKNLFTLTDPMVESIFDFMQSKSDTNVTPKNVEIFGKEIDLKKNIYSSMPYWPYVVTKKIIADESKKQTFDPTDRYPEIIAHYLYKAATGRTYNEKDAEEFAEVILDLPFTVCIQLGNFFLKKQKRIKSSN